MFNDSSIYNVDGIIEDMDRCENNDDSLYDYLRYLNDISLSGIYSQHSSCNNKPTKTRPTSMCFNYSSSPTTYNANYNNTNDLRPVKNNLKCIKPSAVPVISSSLSSSSNDKRFNFNYTNNQVHYHVYDMNYFNSLSSNCSLKSFK